MKIKELEISVPWGHLAAKTWGDADNPIVLVFHGLLDNAGSFNLLIPLLPQHFHYVAVDLPGHGKSSHFPPFFPVHTINIVFAYKLLAKYFKQERYIIIGHSYGAQIGFLFGCLYPKYVEKLIMLDAIHLFPLSADLFHTTVAERFDACLNLHEKLAKGEPPTYTYEEVIKKITESRRWGFITQEGAEALTERAVVSTDNGRYKFTVDQRYKFMINPLHDFSYIIQTLKDCPLKCPVLMVLSRDSAVQQMYMRNLLKVYKKLKNFKLVVVNGSHDVHMNSPEIVSPHLSEFLNNQKAKL